ncbi:MAG: hypothetical protein GX881_07110 [Firmicutes bacterium]|nr:hypothetical protein [Bacillota bacterium]
MNSARASRLGRLAYTSVQCGIIMLAGWFMPFLGLPLGLAGLYMGVTGLTSSRRDLARAGIFLNSLGLALIVLNTYLSYYMLTSGKLEMLLEFTNGGMF